MATKVFLSLDHADESFVAEVKKRLPIGLAYFYVESFANGENLIAAMERGISDSCIFVLFVSPMTTASPWVNFEIEQARLQKITNPNFRILVFPTSPGSILDTLPAWMKSSWIASAGWTPADIARYIATVLLEPNIGLSSASIQVRGRGKSLDRLEQIAADHLSTAKTNPNVYVLAGFRGIGRRTFAAHYMRSSLTGAANLIYGPTLLLPTQTDLFEIYRAIRNEQHPLPTQVQLAADYGAFNEATLEIQIAEINRQMSHFWQLGQAITIVSANGFFEDAGHPKAWFAPWIDAVPSNAMLFLISNRQFRSEFILQRHNLVQMRLEELDDKDIRALMIFTADRLKIDDFSVSNEIVTAIGGHADVANAAVRLVAMKGVHILERDPRQLYNVQNTILGENIEDGALSPIEKTILSLLSWVPKLRGDLLEEVLASGADNDTTLFIDAIERLVLGCLITATGISYSISPSIRILYRRWHVTEPAVLSKFATVLGEAWRRSQQSHQFDADLFDTFVFMHALEGKSLPHELRSLLSAGTLNEVVRDTFARGKENDSSKDLKLAISWGAIATDMRMSEATREDILSTVARARIRLGEFGEAYKEIEGMSKRGYRSAIFLRGHALRRQEKYDDAITALRAALEERKNNRAAVHELALAYKKSGRMEQLRLLLQEYGNILSDSAMFSNFQIGIDIAKGDLVAAEAGIRALSRLPDDEGQADIRRAQVMIRRGEIRAAKNFLSELLKDASRGVFHIRSLRAFTASIDKDFVIARRDIDFIKNLPGRQKSALRLEARLLAEEGNLAAAQASFDQIQNPTAEDWLLQARIWEMKADQVTTGLADRSQLIGEALALRARYKFSLEEDYLE